MKRMQNTIEFQIPVKYTGFRILIYNFGFRIRERDLAGLRIPLHKAI